MNNINIFKIECKCVFTGSDRKIYNCKTIYEDQQVVINNFETITKQIQRDIENELFVCNP